jgi:hypothetical protein
MVRLRMPTLPSGGQHGSVIFSFSTQQHHRDFGGTVAPAHSGAPSATILNDVVAIWVWHAFLNLHCLFAY